MNEKKLLTAGLKIIIFYLIEGTPMALRVIPG
jgi:hypothetical protein